MSDEPTTTEPVIVGESGPEGLTLEQDSRVVPAAELADLTPEDLRKELEKVRREAASWRVKFRDAEPLVQKAKELEEAGKTEAQKLAEQLAEARKTGESASTQLARITAAVKAKLFDANGDLDMDLVDRLRGATAEELEADAQKLGERFARPAGTPAPDPGRRPRPRLDSARPNPGATDDEKDPKKLAEQALKGYL